MSFDSHLDDTCTIQSQTIAADDVGAGKPTWTDAYTDEPCRIEQLSSNERMILGREGAVATHRVYLGRGATGITVQHRMLANSASWDIVSAEPSPSEATIHHHELIVARRT